LWQFEKTNPTHPEASSFRKSAFSSPELPLILGSFRSGAHATLEVMPNKVRWGVLGVAAIAVKKVIPAMQLGERTEVVAIASRDLSRAQKAAGELGIPRAYGSYEELLADPDIDAVYNPLPNHLHVPWSVRAAEANKHVLCEKPLALTTEEAKALIRVRNAIGVKIGEAFMVRTHPQWLRAREVVGSGAVGELRAITSTFSYFNRDPNNIRNMPEIGGGGIMDIGCYPITVSRFLYDREPDRVMALIDYDPELKTDRLASAILDFAPGQASFTCSTQLVPHQRMQILGTKGRIEMEIPYNIPPDRPSRIFIDDGSELGGRSARVEEFPAADQYTIQGDAFSRAIQENEPVPVPLENALSNMAVIEAVLRSGASGRWERPQH
jgi:predicted dehydrogenase